MKDAEHFDDVACAGGYPEHDEVTTFRSSTCNVKAEESLQNFISVFCLGNRRIVGESFERKSQRLRINKRLGFWSLARSWIWFLLSSVV